MVAPVATEGAHYQVPGYRWTATDTTTGQLVPGTQTVNMYTLPPLHYHPLMAMSYQHQAMQAAQLPPALQHLRSIILQK